MYSLHALTVTEFQKERWECSSIRENLAQRRMNGWNLMNKPCKCDSALTHAMQGMAVL